jgi:protease secretion system outer membrane protein
MSPAMHAFLTRPLVLLAGLFAAHSALANNLFDDYQSARKNDATFAASFADYETGRIQARTASTAYYPQANFSRTQLPNESGSRQTFTISQPILNADRWLSLQEAEPRNALADVGLQKNQFELAHRLFSVVSALSASREKLLLNQTNIDALQAQTDSAQRAFQLGMGTVTDVYDAQVRLAQARSQSLILRSTLQAATRQYETIVGTRPQLDSYILANNMSALKLPALETFMDQARSINPSIRASEIGTLIGEITRKRAKAVFLPSLNASVQRSQFGDNTITSSGITLRLDIPLDMSSYSRIETADLALQKLKDTERAVKQQVELDIQRLHSDVQASLSEIAIRLEAIKAAELSVNANEQSFKGGVRSALDVLNALQALHQTKNDYVTALLQLGERLLNLQITAAVDIDLALKQVQTQLFKP